MSQPVAMHERLPVPVCEEGLPAVSEHMSCIGIHGACKNARVHWQRTAPLRSKLKYYQEEWGKARARACCCAGLFVWLSPCLRQPCQLWKESSWEGDLKPRSCTAFLSVGS